MNKRDNSSLGIKQYGIHCLLYCAFFVISLCPAQANSNPDDVYLKGYLSGVLEQHLGWPGSHYQITVIHSVAQVNYFQRQPSDLTKAREIFSRTAGLIDFNFIKSTLDETRERPAYIHYPHGDYFQASIADVKEPQFFISFMQANSSGDDFLIGSVGLGQNFGLYRWPSENINNGWQLSFFTALFSQFNMDASSDDLVNSDYLIGLPLSFRFGDFSGRFRLFHQSSHLGDELLLSDEAPERVNLSIEAIDITLAYDVGYWRGTLGLMQLIQHDPSYLKDGSASAGIDYRNPTPLLGNSRFIAGIHTRWLEDVNWKSGSSFKMGFEIGQRSPDRHGTRLLFEAYKGLIPFGQFYVDDIEYYGLGWYIDFN